MKNKPKVLACVQARTGSTRMPGKVLKTLLGKPYLQIMYERVKLAHSLDEVMIITSTEKKDDVIENLCKELAIPYHRGSENDLLDRHYQAAQKANADFVLKIPSDSPLTDYTLIDKMVNFWLENQNEYDFVTNISPGTFPDGLDVEGCTFSALEKAWKVADKDYQREHTFPYVWENPQLFKIKNFTNPIESEQNMFMTHRWTLDYAEDFEFIQTVFEHFKNHFAFTMTDVLELLKQKPQIAKINSKFAGVNWYRNEQSDLNIPRYMYKNKEKISLEKSLEHYKRACKVIPLGSHTYSKSSMQWSLGAVPQYLESAKGCEIVDVDGNKYIDYGMALGPFILGYGDEDVNNAIKTQLDKGTMFTLSSKIEAEAAEKVIEAVPCAEMVRFGKNGSDVTSTAVKLARAYTGKEKIIICGYHGWQDWYIASTERSAGIPKAYTDLVLSTKYNDFEYLEKLIEENKDEIAGMIMEPVGAVKPENNYLQKVREITEKHGIVLIFDELFTGFRWSIGGAQKYFDVTPDLACFGKAIANGMPVSCVCGKKELMDQMDKVFFSGTYLAETMSLAAIIKNLEKLESEKVHAHIEKWGQYLIDGFREKVKKNNLEDIISIIGYPFKSVINFTTNEKHTSNELKTYFQQECAQRGVLFIGYHLISLAHKKEHIDFTLEVYDEIMQNLKENLDKGIAVKDLLFGEVIVDVFKNVGDRSSYGKAKK